MAIEFESFANDVIDIHIRDGGAAGGGGKIKTVNRKAPDEDGNVNVVAWEEGTSETVRIYFDGTLEGKEYIEEPVFDDTGYIIKLADYREGMLDPELWLGRTYTVRDGDGEYTATIDDTVEVPLTDTVTALGVSKAELTIIPETVTLTNPEDATIGYTFTKGVWFHILRDVLEAEGGFQIEITPSLEYPAEIHKLEPKFLPDGNGWYETVPKRRLVFSGKVEDYEHHWLDEYYVRVKISDDITGLALPYGFDPKNSNDYDYTLRNGLLAPDAVGRVWEQMRFAGYYEGEYYGLGTEMYRFYTYDTAEAPLYTLLDSNEIPLIHVIQYPTPEFGNYSEDGVIFTPGIWLDLYYEDGYEPGKPPTNSVTSVEIPEGRIYHEVDPGILPKGIGQDVRQEEPVEIVYDGDPESHEYIVMEQEESEGHSSYTYLVKLSDTPYKAGIFNLGIMEMVGRHMELDENGDALLEDLSMPYWIQEAMDMPGMGFGVIIVEPGLLVLRVEDPKLMAAVLDASSGGEAGEALLDLTPGMWAMHIGERAVDEDGNVLYEMAVWVGKMISKPQPSLWIKPIHARYLPEEGLNPYYVTTAIHLDTTSTRCYCVDDYDKLVMIAEGDPEYAMVTGATYKGLQLTVEEFLLDMYQFDVSGTREYDSRNLRYISFRSITDSEFFGDIAEEMGIDPGSLVWIEAKVWQDRIVEIQVIPIEIGGVHTVNGVAPDENGNVEIAALTTEEFNELMAALEEEESEVQTDE